IWHAVRPARARFHQDDPRLPHGAWRSSPLADVGRPFHPHVSDPTAVRRVQGDVEADRDLGKGGPNERELGVEGEISEGL
ncbi:MAG: hypothetical protein M4579_007029, partial [Chaenotheca gracillima]